ncbi:hypothetical protein JHK87_010683 [Glycine soja]|nr:hypothetical protein JHK87_010683 [Glycine soja]
MPFSKCWKWILKFMQSFFKTSSPCASPPPPPVELCNDALFEIFLRLPPEVLPRFSTLNKQSNEIINSPLFQTTYWTQTLGLPRLCGIVYFQRPSLSISFRFQSSSYTGLLQWACPMLQYYYMEPNVVKIHKQSVNIQGIQRNCYSSIRKQSFAGCEVGRESV